MPTPLPAGTPSIPSCRSTSRCEEAGPQGAAFRKCARHAAQLHALRCSPPPHRAPLTRPALPPPPPLPQIHWFSIVNSCVTVLLLTGFLATILMRVLKNDFIKYTNVRDDEALEDAEETGWKVGRAPRLGAPGEGGGSSLQCLILPWSESPLTAHQSGGTAS